MARDREIKVVVRPIPGFADLLARVEALEERNRRTDEVAPGEAIKALADVISAQIIGSSLRRPPPDGDTGLVP